MKRKVVSKWPVIVSLMLIVACHHEETQPSAQAVTTFPKSLQVEKVALRKVPQYYEVVGTIKAKTQSILSSKIIGHVTQVQVEEGEFVKKGQLLMVIDDRDIAAKLAQAQAAVQSAKDTKIEVEKGLNLVKARKQQALSNLELAQTTYHRYQELFKQNAVSAHDFDTVKIKLDLAQDEVKVAGESIAQMLSKQAQVGSAIHQAQAGVREVQVMESFAKITAPFDGLVTQKNVAVGSLAAPGAPLLVLESQDKLQLEVDVRESELAKNFHRGDPVSVKIDALNHQPNKPFIAGLIDEVVPTADPMSRTFKVKILLPPTPGITSGMYGRARFSREAQTGLFISQKARVKKGQLEQVFVLDSQNIAHLRLIKTGKILGDQIEVLSGLQDHEMLVDPQPGLKDNDKVKLEKQS